MLTDDAPLQWFHSLLKNRMPHTVMPFPWQGTQAVTKVNLPPDISLLPLVIAFSCHASDCITYRFFLVSSSLWHGVYRCQPILLNDPCGINPTELPSVLFSVISQDYLRFTQHSVKRRQGKSILLRLTISMDMAAICQITFTPLTRCYQCQATILYVIDHYL